MRYLYYEEKDLKAALGGFFDEYEKIAGVINELVAKAHDDIVDGQCLSWPVVDGYISNFLSLYGQAQLDQQHNFQLPMAAGYGVERSCYENLKRYYKGTKLNFGLDLQVASGMTRPDIVVTCPPGTGVKPIWLDITSSASVGHIVKSKTGWNSHFCEEITYEEFDWSLVLRGVTASKSSANLQKKEAYEFIARMDQVQDEKMRGSIAQLYDEKGRDFKEFKDFVSVTLPDVTDRNIREILMFAGCSQNKSWKKGSTPNATANGRKLWNDLINAQVGWEDKI